MSVTGRRATRTVISSARIAAGLGDGRRTGRQCPVDSVELCRREDSALDQPDRVWTPLARKVGGHREPAHVALAYYSSNDPADLVVRRCADGGPVLGHALGERSTSSWASRGYAWS